MNRLRELWAKLRPGQRIALVAAGLALLYLAIAASGPPLGFWSPDSEIKFLQLQNLRWEGGPKIDLRLPGRPLDPNFFAVPLGHAFYEVREGHVFLVWSIVFPLASLPFYKLFGPLGLFVIPAISGAGAAYVTGRMAEHLRPRSGIWAALLVGLTTPILLYSAAFWEHTLAVFCSTWGIYKVATSERIFARVAGGVAIGFAAGTLRADVYPLVAAFVLVAIVVDRKRAAALVSGLALASAPSWAVNMLLHKHMLPLNAAKNFTHFSLEYLRARTWRFFPDFIAGRGVALEIATVFAILAIVAALLLRFTRDEARAPVAKTWLFPPILAALAVLAFVGAHTLLEMQPAPAAFHGFLSISPFLLMAAAFHPATSHDPKTGRMLALTTSLYVVLYAASISTATPLGPAGGFLEWGPRFFLPIYPLGIALATAAAPAWLEGTEGVRRTALVASLASLVLVGAMDEATGLRVLGTQTRNRHALRQMLSASNEPVISDVWWALLTPTGAGADKPMFFAWYFELFRDLVLNARAAGATEVTLISFFDFEHHPLAQRAKAEGLPLTLVSSQETGLKLHVMRLHVDPPR